MENIIHEVYFHTNDSPELEAFVKSYLGDMPLNSMYWHFGYMNKMTKGRVIYQKGSTDDFRKEIHSKTIMDKLKEIQYPNHEKVAYVLASHGIPNFDFNTCPKPAFNIPEPVYEIGRRTNGYLLYRRQAIQLYRFITKCDEYTANQWVRNWNKKVPQVRNQADNLFIEDVSLSTLFTLNPNIFFISEPGIFETKYILRKIFKIG